MTTQREDSMEAIRNRYLAEEGELDPAGKLALLQMTHLVEREIWFLGKLAGELARARNLRSGGEEEAA